MVLIAIGGYRLSGLRSFLKTNRGGNADLPTALTGVRIIRFPKVCSHCSSRKGMLETEKRERSR